MEFEPIQFYGLGTIELAHLSKNPKLNANGSDYSKAIAFRFVGAQTRAALVLLDSEIDIEMGKELGNLLASRLAGFLSREEGWDVLISPPQVWGADSIRHAPQASRQLQFEFKTKNRTIEVPVLFFEGDVVHV